MLLMIGFFAIVADNPARFKAKSSIAIMPETAMIRTN
jgi:hypothetical protein